MVIVQADNVVPGKDTVEPLVLFVMLVVKLDMVIVVFLLMDVVEVAMVVPYVQVVNVVPSMVIVDILLLIVTLVPVVKPYLVNVIVLL